MQFVFRKFSVSLALKELPTHYKPSNIYDLDIFPKQYEDFVSKLGSEYPGYNDPIYMNWLKKVRNAPSRIGKVNKVEYNSDHIQTWSTLYSKLRELHYEFACEEHIENLRELEDYDIISSNEVPNFVKINKYLKHKSGFQMVNVGGMVEPRIFLYGLAFKVFYSTQYIRHKSVPFYSPEPDIVHEVMGHVPMLANKEFAKFSQGIGRKALGAPDDVIDILGKVYFFTVEFGILSDKVFGAGILGSCKELEHVGTGKGKIDEWNLEKVVKQNLTLSDYQPQYVDVGSLSNLKDIFAEVSEYLDL
ncbi:hypothetical protein SteCoe_1780 [Stentor coeruleus]|uniref:phenylalanine 4-monooxygenase n=1 Tax=Stentor coeruleus TaxID=5963 RepID=A0A1R2D126_9CILI|nr:hypothetical protein SteCoe_1780 [Stentor coeruleus]